MGEINEIERIIFYQADRFRAFSAAYPLSIENNEKRDQISKKLNFAWILKNIEKDKEKEIRNKALKIAQQRDSTILESMSNSKRNSPLAATAVSIKNSRVYQPNKNKQTKEEFTSYRTTAGTALEKTVYSINNERSARCIISFI